MTGPGSLTGILNLVGKLDDTPGDDSARKRFRDHLRDEVTSVGQVRDFVEECLRESGDRYNRAFQDLINHLGSLLGFEVVYGRYQGVPNEIGFDGLWTSPEGLSIVVEVKTTDAFTVKTATLVNYINELVSDGRIESSDEAIGLYVVGRPDKSFSQLANSIVAEKKTDQLRIVSAEHLLSLAELIRDNEMRHGSVLTVLQPSGPSLDPLIDLITDLVAVSAAEEAQRSISVGAEAVELDSDSVDAQPRYYLTSAQGDDDRSAEEWICYLLEEGVWAFGENTPRREEVQEGDWICFYASGNGVIGHGRVKKAPCKRAEASHKAREITRFPYPLELDRANLYPEKPIAITADIRRQLEEFEGRDPSKSWGWFVQTLRKITRNDFHVLTRQG